MDTIIAIASAQGHAALGVIRLSGPNALACAQAGFKDAKGGALGQAAPRTLQFGNWCDPSGVVMDSVLAVYFKAPASATGEDVVEIHAHGGWRNLQALQASMLTQGQDLGLRLAQPGEFTQRAFIHGKLDLTQAEAVIDLIQAGSELARSVAARQLSGALSQKVQAMQRNVHSAVVALEASLDFLEEDPSIAQAALAAQAQLGQAQASLQSLLLSARSGMAMRQGLRVALCGRSNAGKSSLLNALVGRERALVHETPGTTRDYLEASLELQGLQVTFVDTAGERATTDAVEAAGLAQGRQQAHLADLRLYLTDAQSGWTLEDEQGFLKMDKPVWKIAAKMDLLESGWQMNDFQFACSAQTGLGLETLKKALYKFAIEGDAAVLLEQGLITQARHEDALKRAGEALKRAIEALSSGAPVDLVLQDLYEALDAMSELTGQTFRQEVLDSIFTRFCVGK
jgi:tRNA modification GTPase